MSPLDSEDDVRGLVELEARVVYGTLHCSVESRTGDAVDSDPDILTVGDTGIVMSRR